MYFNFIAIYNSPVPQLNNNNNNNSIKCWNTEKTKRKMQNEIKKKTENRLQTDPHWMPHSEHFLFARDGPAGQAGANDHCALAWTAW